MPNFFTSAVLNSIPGIRHGFGNQMQPVPEIVAGFSETWEKTKPIWKQVHGIQAVQVQHPQQLCLETDALYTFTSQQPVAVVTADCVPILLAEKTGKAVAAIHAGWKGTLARIVRNTFLKILNETQTKASDWYAAIGPCIHPCCYEVGTDVIDSFLTEFSFIPPDVVQPTYRKLNLPELHIYDLKNLGVNEIDSAAECTYCSRRNNENKYFSYRRNKNSSRQWNIIFKER